MSLARSSASRSILAKMSSASRGRGGCHRRRRGGRGAAPQHGQVGHPHQAVLAGEGQRLVAALLLREPADPVIAGVVDRHLSVPRDGEAPRRREEGVAKVVLRPDRGRAAELGGPPFGRGQRSRHEQADTDAARLALWDWDWRAATVGAKRPAARSSPASSAQSASTRPFSALLNMSPTMTMPPCAHWPMPPRSGWLNCAWLPPPATNAASSSTTAPSLTPWRRATSPTMRRPSAVNSGMMAVPDRPDRVPRLPPMAYHRQRGVGRGDTTPARNLSGQIMNLRCAFCRCHSSGNPSSRSSSCSSAGCRPSRIASTISGASSVSRSTRLR